VPRNASERGALHVRRGVAVLAVVVKVPSPGFCEGGSWVVGDTVIVEGKDERVCWGGARVC